MVQLLGKVLVKGIIETKTGLHVGGSSTGLEIGGVDSVVIRDPVTNRPYIPGSSLKGSMRSLLEKAEGKKPNKSVNKSRIHMCEKADDYRNCNICKIFGVTADSIEDVTENTITLTRLIVRDATMLEDSANTLEKADTDLPYTDVKTEVVIDRITSAANPRQIERVPAGVNFDFEMVYNIYEEADKTNLKTVFDSMCLLEDDHLGGQGSRGYGKVEFKCIALEWRPKDYYITGDEKKLCKGFNGDSSTPKEIAKNFDEIIAKINTQQIP